MTPSPEHIRKMQAGRKRAQDRAAQQAIARVTEYTAWLKAGSVLRDIPCVPTDADYAVARSRGLKV